MTSPIAGEREAEAFDAHIKTTAWYQVLSQAKDEDDEGASVFRMARMAADAAWQARAALLEPVGEGWQPIETAPRSVQPILVYNQSGRVAIETGHFMHNMMQAAKVDGEECFYTHWHPLPASPKTNGGMGS